MVEDGSRVHIQRITDLMSSDYDWATIAMVSLLAAESEVIGSWAEGCMCHDMVQGNVNKRDARDCPYRCCRAPELAAGFGLAQLCRKMMANREDFNAYASRAPLLRRTELLGSWATACSKLFGQMTAKLGHWQELPWLLCHRLN